MTDAPLSHALSPKGGKYLKPEVELELLAKYKESGCTVSLNRILLNYSDFCMRFANRYKAKFDIEDTYQDVMEFLILTARRYDPSHGVPFFTFAYVQVGHLMSMRAIRKWASVTTPGTKAFFKAFRAMSRYGQGDMTYAKATELAAEIGVSLDDVYAAQAIYKDSTLSLNASVHDDGTEMQELLADACDPADLVIKADFEQKREREFTLRLASLSPRDNRIISARHLTDAPLKLHDLAAEFGVSAERVRQLEAKAITKLREAA